jgi:uncharacterized protein
VLGTGTARVLIGRQLPEARTLAARDPVSNVFVASRIAAAGLETWRLGGELWGWFVGGRLEALCYAGANLVPVEAGPDAISGFAERARRLGRRCSSIVGPAAAVGPLWERLEPHWGPARDVRPCQPLMTTSAPARDVLPDPAVRPVRPDEVETLLPACVAMHTEEVGVSPLGIDGGAHYRARVHELVRAGRAYAHIEGGRVLFKAEVAAATAEVCQIQGVWVDPSERGKGLSVSGMAAVLDLALRDVAPVVSLYVNDYNLPALAAYRRVGFAQVGAFMSVLF